MKNCCGDDTEAKPKKGGAQPPTPRDCVSKATTFVCSPKQTLISNISVLFSSLLKLLCCGLALGLSP